MTQKYGDEGDREGKRGEGWDKVLCARRRPKVSDCFTPACSDSHAPPLVLFILYLVYPSVTDTRLTKKMDWV